MSSGHNHPYAPGIGHATVNKLQEDPELQAASRRWMRIDRDHDLPYLAGYSTDAKTIYIDRHLPEKIEYERDGRKRSMYTERYLITHESWEKALIDIRGWSYAAAHRAAEAIEDREGTMDGISPREKAAVFAPFIKADDIEKLTRVPADLDMTPYLAPPVSKLLLARMKKAMKKSKPKQQESSMATIGIFR